jgi:predicted acyltransferase
VAYWLIIALTPVPGYGAGVLEPEGNVIFYLDNLVFAKHHVRYDGLGLISTLTAISTTLLGALTGQLLQDQHSPLAKSRWMVAGGSLMIVAGLIMNRWIPINKSLWTPSFTLFTGGGALITFAACYWLIEIKGYRRWAIPLAIFGKNALVIFVLSETLSALLIRKGVGVADSNGEILSVKRYVFEIVFTPLGSPMNASLYFGLAWLLMMFAVSYWLYPQ